jgi:hypothetical protein
MEVVRLLCCQNLIFIYDMYAPHNNVSVNNGLRIQSWFHSIIIVYYNAYRCVTLAYSNVLYGSVAQPFRRCGNLDLALHISRYP